MVYVPTPAVAGLKVPLVPEVIPVPVHVPPAVAAVKLNAGVPRQIGVTLLMVASAAVVPVIVTVEVDAGQGAFVMLH